MPDANKNREKDLAAVESALFVLGESVSLTKLAVILNKDREEAETLVQELGEDLENDPKRGLRVLRDGENVQLVTKPSLNSIAAKAVKELLNENLTPAALETLSLAAYGGPLTRAEIDYLRGVNSAFTLRNLLVRGLLERDHGGSAGAYLYKTTAGFLRHLGFRMIQDLPGYLEQRNLIRSFIQKENGNAPQLSA